MNWVYCTVRTGLSLRVLYVCMHACMFIITTVLPAGRGWPLEGKQALIKSVDLSSVFPSLFPSYFSRSSCFFFSSFPLFSLASIGKATS